MQGYVDAQLYDARGLRDEDFLALKQEQGGQAVLDLLQNELKLEQHVHGKNLVHDNFAGWIFHEVLGGPNPASPFEEGGSNSAYLSFINLSVRDNEPYYTEQFGNGDYTNNNYHQFNDTANGSSGSKLFKDHYIVTPEVFLDPDGRQGMIYRTQWLWTPSEGVSSNIRSISIVWQENQTKTGTGYGSSRQIACRIRLKDAGGTPVIINKTTNQVLLVEYNFKLVSV